MSNSTFSKIKTCLGTATVAVALVVGASALSYYGFANPNTFFIGEDKVANAANGSLAVSLDDPADENSDSNNEDSTETTVEDNTEDVVIRGATIDRDERIQKAREDNPAISERQAELVKAMQADGGIDDAPVFNVEYTLPEKFMVGLKESLTSMIPSDPVLNVATSASKGGQSISSNSQLVAFSKTTGILRVYGTLAEIKANGGGTQIGNGWQAFTSIHINDWNGDGVPDIIGFKNKELYIYKGIKGKPGFVAPDHVATFGYNNARPVVGKARPTDKYPGVLALHTDGQVVSYTRKDARSVGSGEWIARNIPANSQIMQTNMTSGASDLIIRPKSGRFEVFQSQANNYQISQLSDASGSDMGSSSYRQTSIDGFAGSGTRGIIEVNHTESSGSGTLYYRSLNTAGALGAKQKIGTNGWTVMVLSNGSYKNNP